MLLGIVEATDGTKDAIELFTLKKSVVWDISSDSELVVVERILNLYCPLNMSSGKTPFIREV